MIETYQEELEKIISSLEQELNDLLKERKKKLFTFKLDKQVLRIRNLLNKFKAENLIILVSYLFLSYGIYLELFHTLC